MKSITIMLAAAAAIAALPSSGALSQQNACSNNYVSCVDTCIKKSAASFQDRCIETCQQRTEGAFGPNGGANRTITVVGNGMSILSGSGGATLVSIFAIPPTFDATVDSAGDLPGPGAVSLVGTASLCSTAGTCP